MMLYRTCTACNDIKIITDFSKLKKGKYGRRSRCKLCSNKNLKKYYKDNIEKRKEYMSKYRENKKWHGVDKFTTKFMEWCDDGLA